VSSSQSQKKGGNEKKEENGENGSPQPPIVAGPAFLFAQVRILSLAGCGLGDGGVLDLALLLGVPRARLLTAATAAAAAAALKQAGGQESGTDAAGPEEEEDGQQTLTHLPLRHLAELNLADNGLTGYFSSDHFTANQTRAQSPSANQTRTQSRSREGSPGRPVEEFATSSESVQEVVKEDESRERAALVSWGGLLGRALALRRATLRALDLSDNAQLADAPVAALLHAISSISLTDPPAHFALARVELRGTETGNGAALALASCALVTRKKPTKTKKQKRPPQLAARLLEPGLGC